MTTRTRLNDTSSTTSGTGGTEPTSLSDAASNVAGEAGKTIEQTAADGMSQVSDVLRQVADAVRQASQNLQTEQPQVGRFISAGADKLDEAASYVAQRRPSEMMDGAQSFARRQPAVVIGGGLVAGLLLGRVLRNAGGQSWQGTQTGQDWYGSGYSGMSGSVGTTGSLGTTGVSSGYGTGYGATYDRGTQDVTARTGYGTMSSTTNGGSATEGGSMTDRGSMTSMSDGESIKGGGSHTDPAEG